MAFSDFGYIANASFRRYSRSKSVVVQNLPKFRILLAPIFLGERPPNFRSGIIQFSQFLADHVAKFQGDRLRDLEDPALKKKHHEHFVRPPVTTYGRTNKYKIFHQGDPVGTVMLAVYKVELVDPLNTPLLSHRSIFFVFPQFPSHTGCITYTHICYSLNPFLSCPLQNIGKYGNDTLAYGCHDSRVTTPEIWALEAVEGLASQVSAVGTVSL